MTTFRIRRPRVLVVDDNQVTRIAAARMLEKLGADADVAADGLEAIAASRHTSYDLVLMDCEMPQMDGFAATAEIRGIEAQDAATRRLPIVAITASALKGVREKCRAVGMDDFLAKPIRLAQLREVMARWEGHFSQAEAAPLVDFSVLDEIRDMDPSIADQLIEEFNKVVRAGETDLRQAIAQRDSKTVARLSHRLRGSCLAVGANTMAEIGADIERAAHAEDFARCATLIEQVGPEFVRVQEEFKIN